MRGGRFSRGTDFTRITEALSGVQLNERIASARSVSKSECMKIPLIYGAGVAVGVAIVTMILLALGYHADLLSYQKSQGIGSMICFAIVVSGIGLAIKAQRNRTPLDIPFGFAEAFKTGALTALFIGLFGAFVNFAYFRFINPDLVEIVTQANIQSAKKGGLAGEDLAKFERDARTMMTPQAQAIGGFLITLFMSIFISAFAAFIMRRKNVPSPSIPTS